MWMYMSVYLKNVIIGGCRIGIGQEFFRVILYFNVIKHKQINRVTLGEGGSFVVNNNITICRHNVIIVS